MSFDLQYLALLAFLTLYVLLFALLFAPKKKGTVHWAATVVLERLPEGETATLVESEVTCISCQHGLKGGSFNGK